MSKGVLGIGCSYTWGEGLYYYSDISDVKNMLSKEHYFDSSLIREPHLIYKNKKAYTNLVAEHYNTWSYISGGNGGDNVFSFKQRMLSMFPNNNHSFKSNDFSLIIYQFTQIERNTNYSIPEQIEFVDHYLSKWESEGIKCVTITWPWEIKDSEFYLNKFKNRHVPITYRDKVYDCFEEIVNLKENDVTIESDFKKQNLQKNDLHFNPRGHQLIADSIIKKLEEDNFTL